MGAGAGKREMFEDFAIVTGLVAVQFVYAGNSVLLSYLMELGLNPLTIVIFSTFSTFLVLSLPSIYFERSKWPKNFTLRLFFQLVLMAFAGVTLFQTLFLKGIKLTSPAIATAMPNLAPGLIFIIAVAFRLEKVKLSCIYSKVKIVGTLLCVIGALTMSIMQSSINNTTELPKQNHTSSSHDDDGLIYFDQNKVMGCMYLVAAVVVLSSNIVLQAKILTEFPAPVSICTITSLIGVFITLVIEFIRNHKLEFWMPDVISTQDLIGYCLLGGTISGVCFSFNGWAIKKRGPVLVSMFSPISTVVSAIVSFFTLGEVLPIGSLFGMVLMFTGLYFFLWAKGKEGFSYPGAVALEGGEPYDMEKPLLS
ncbi:WAT1-related protein At5g47470 [Impatiens glandulifera]|uniref:WAT1-related protein At5g47470 n=1 Tax=Impatiens glandulifera TaxID=253017 RepID=UPI001FB051B9|nr:WAT1-related protein At5g47470 [Impatiens glandulifera]